MKKKNAIIIAVVACVLVLGIGFALFSETVNINGTVKAEGNMDVEFTKVGAITEQVGYTQQSATINEKLTSDIAVISDDKNTLTLNINKLEYPGAKVTFPVTITNVGSIPVVFESISATESVDSTGDLKISYVVTPSASTTIQTNGTQTLTITAEWLVKEQQSQQSTLTIDPIDIKLNYKQITAK